MSRYIDIDNIKVSDYVTVWDCNCSEYGRQTVMAVDDLNYLPTVDIEPVKRGEWIKTPRTYLMLTGEMPTDEHGNIYAKREHKTIFRLKCSCCGLTEDVESDFCPNCGADMRGV